MDLDLRAWGGRSARRSRRAASTATHALLRHGPLVVVALAGAVTAVAVFGHVSVPVGPFDTTMTARPVSAGGTDVELAPLGRIEVDSHRGPLGLDLRVDQLREREARSFIDAPSEFPVAKAALAEDVQQGLRRLIIRVVLAATLGGALAALAWRRHWSAAVIGLLVGLLASGGAVGVALASWDADSLTEPRYSGLLTLAPQAIGDARDVVDRFSDHRAQLANIVENVATLYQTADQLQSFRPDGSTIRVLHVSDLHLNPEGFDLMEQIVQQFAVDVVVDTGDLNDWGTTLEGRFARRIRGLGVPYVFVRGNHDSAATARAVRRQPNAVVLNGHAETVAGLTFWGRGDPRFTPDKSLEGSGDDERAVAEETAPLVAAAVRDERRPIDVVVVHDPTIATDLAGLVPLVLAGHRHRPDRLTLGEDTTVLVEGSTGGAGLRALDGDEAVPLSCSVLYFDADERTLEAMDRIEVGGPDRSQVSIERHIVRVEGDGDAPSG